MDAQGINQLLGQMQAAADLAAEKGRARPATGNADFSSVLKTYIGDVNQQQQHASDLSKQFELGSPNTNLQDVMVSLQKANVSFQTMVQVRNKLVTAYQEIMSMQV